ncbi:MAG: GNAT family N-acetyltransferase [Bacteroidota bacterium]
MKIKIEETDTKGVFAALEDEMQIGEMTFSNANDGKLMIIDHTQVNPDQNGKGVGKFLFEEMVKFARKEDRKVLPLCPFAKAMFQKNKSEWDVLRNGAP